MVAHADQRGEDLILIGELAHAGQGGGLGQGGAEIERLGLANRGGYGLRDQFVERVDMDGLERCDCVRGGQERFGSGTQSV